MAMASRKTPPLNRDSFHPSSEGAVYRDLLLFEERLKTNAFLLKKRKSRYQLFLVQLAAIILFLMAEVLLRTRFLDMPIDYVFRLAFPEALSENEQVELHPYVAKGLLFVAITTLLLFFASGLYEEKIAYANRYVPHANKALRNFNMYLNVRHKPLRSRITLNPLSLFRRGSPMTSPEPPPRVSSPDRRRKRGTSVPIAPIPPASSPRGELIFSSRVDRSFRESYEKYRAKFERRRVEKEEYELAQTWRGWRVWPWNWSRQITMQAASYVREHITTNSIATSHQRGRDSDSDSAPATPKSSRRSSPVPGSLGRPKNGPGGSRSGTPPRAIPRRLTPDRARTESFSFIMSDDEVFR